MSVYYNNHDLHAITCAGFVMKTPDNQIVLVKSEGKYSFPKGKYEKKKDGKPKELDTLYACALRELVEETEMYNYKFKTTKNLSKLFVEKTNILYFPGVIETKFENFTVNFTPNDEIDELHWLSEDQIKKLPSEVFKTERKAIALAHLNNSNGDQFDIVEQILNS